MEHQRCVHTEGSRQKLQPLQKTMPWCPSPSGPWSARGAHVGSHTFCSAAPSPRAPAPLNQRSRLNPAHCHCSGCQAHQAPLYQHLRPLPNLSVGCWSPCLTRLPCQCLCRRPTSETGLFYSLAHPSRMETFTASLWALQRSQFPASRSSRWLLRMLTWAEKSVVSSQLYPTISIQEMN